MRWIFAPITAILLATVGCSLSQSKPAPVTELGASTPAAASNAGAPMLQLALEQYDAGQYKRATHSFLQSLDAGLRPAQQILAHKHLAFIYCTSNKANLCREEFRKAIVLDARFDLAPAEAGHPQWGPVFRYVKSRQAAGL